MALETLKDVKKIGGFDVGRDMQEDDKHVFVTDQWISFRIQNGPIKEHGVNGCQVDTLIHAAKKIIGGLNEQYPCSQNHQALAALDVALAALLKRKEDRENRGVEGTSKS